MKKICFLMCIAVLCLAIPEVNAQKRATIGITVVKDIKRGGLKMEQESAVVNGDVVVDGKVLIADKTPIVLDIQFTKRAGMGKPETITVKPVSTVDVNGNLIRIECDAKTKSGKDKRGAAIGCGVAFGIVLFPFGFFFFCLKGGHAKIPAGSQWAGDVVIY